MRFYSVDRDRWVTLDRRIGGGGEGAVWTIREDAVLLAKIYHAPEKTPARKLRLMLDDPPADPMAQRGHASIAWPVDCLAEGRGSAIRGLLMPRLDGMMPLHQVFNLRDRLRRCPSVTYKFLYAAAANLMSSAAALHAKGYVIGDVNESNVLVALNSFTSWIDTDSFQVFDPRAGRQLRCPVFTPQFTPPELQGKDVAAVDRTPAHDLFGLAVLAHLLLLEGFHPFRAVWTPKDEPPPIEERIRRGLYPYMPDPLVRVPPAALSYDVLDPGVRDLFVRAFLEGHRDPARRPDAAEWWTRLRAALERFTTCEITSRHEYPAHLDRCPWCERRELLRQDPFPPSGAALPAPRPAAQPGYVVVPPAPRTPAALRPTPRGYVPPIAGVRRRRRSFAFLRRPLALVLIGAGIWLLVLLLRGVEWRRLGVSEIPGRAPDSRPGPAVPATAPIITDPREPVHRGIYHGPFGIDFIYLRAGSFEAAEASGASEPSSVTIPRGFFISTTEITQRQWFAVVGSRPWEGVPDVRGNDDAPAFAVSANDADGFCRLLQQAEPAPGGATFRLPTAAEWEYACRAGSKARYAFGDSPAALAEYAWYEKGGAEKRLEAPEAVARKRPNIWGLYDMHGNVREWCAPDPAARGDRRILAGGSYYLGADACRAASRDLVSAKIRYVDAGLRIVF